MQLYYLPALIFDEAQANWATAQGQIDFDVIMEDDDWLRAVDSAVQRVKPKYSPVRINLPIQAVRIARVPGTRIAGLDNTGSSWNWRSYWPQARKCHLSVKCVDYVACEAISKDFTNRLPEFLRNFRVYYSLTKRIDGRLSELDRFEAHSINVLNRNIGHPVGDVIMAEAGERVARPFFFTTVALPSTADGK